MLRQLARDLHFHRIAANSPASIQRNIARWESGASTPKQQYQVLLAHAFARTATGHASLGPGSDLSALLDAFAEAGATAVWLAELTASVTASVTRTNLNLLAFLSEPLSADLSSALQDPGRVSPALLAELAAANNAVNEQVGSVPFVRLHLAQAAIVDVCRRLLAAPLHDDVHTTLSGVAASAFALAARLAFETHDDASALALYDEAVSAAAAPTNLAARSLVRTSQTMVIHYATGDLGRARAVVDLAVQDARRTESALLRARAHALQAEMAARAGEHRHAHAALHLAWHDLDQDLSGDPGEGAFSRGRLQGFEGVCGIFMGGAEAAEKQLANAGATLTRPRDTVQRAIVLTDQALARLNTGGAGAAETSAELLHQCVDLVAATRGRVPAQRLRQTRLALRPWRAEAFVADLDDHIHMSLIGL